MNALSYPDYWPISKYSPPVEAIQTAYIKGEVADAALDNELEWSMEYPDPPADVIIEGDKCLLISSNLYYSGPLEDLVNDDLVEITIELEEFEMSFHCGPIQHQNVEFTISCHVDDLEAVFDALSAGDPK